MKSKITWLIIGLAVIPLLFGCAPKNRMTRDEVIQQQAERLMAPSKPLNQYANYKLVGMELTEKITKDEKKVKAAEDLENKLNARLTPLLDSWSGKNPNAAGTLLIKPVLQSLYIVSGGARFWVGGMAGDSNIDMDLHLVEEGSNTKIGAARIERSASGMKGGWSIGATDRALPDYIVDVAHQYLVHNYSTSN